ncbi:MAG: Lrp/AsnC family transcriptional regulator [Alphaproteobacteria bacterium]|nr:MAG: Lrp/AsnC family transcriptional regulator [Alphaproteobacteria bacterium]
MGPDDIDRRLIAALEDGLPIVPRPYAELGARLGLGEDEIIVRLARLIELGLVRRFGVIVRHRALGYRANAMVVWDVPAERIATAAQRLAALPFVTLCYRRPRRLPAWPYTLYCMIHGRDRAAVMTLIERATEAAGLHDVPRAVLFSRRCFKQCGARYGAPPQSPDTAGTEETAE